MAAVTATGLVVRGTDWSETSRIVTLFTREHGKVRALAKGGRRLKSNFEIALDLLTVCRVTYLRKAHGGLDLLTEAQSVERFPHLRTHLPAHFAGSYAAELLADGTQDYDPHPDLFDAALLLLRTPPGSVPPAVAGFELVWLRELGYSPRLEGCAVCEGPVPQGRVTFSAAAGGLVCGDCGRGLSDRCDLSADGVAVLRGLVNGATPAAVPADTRRAVGQAVCTVLGRRPKLLAYVEAGFG